MEQVNEERVAKSREAEALRERIAFGCWGQHKACVGCIAWVKDAQSVGWNPATGTGSYKALSSPGAAKAAKTSLETEIDDGRDAADGWKEPASTSAHDPDDYLKREAKRRNSRRASRS